MNTNGRYTCNKEIGSVAKGWHACGARATYGIERASAQGHSHALTESLRDVQSLRTTAQRVLP